jgi:hypothetical protein
MRIVRERAEAIGADLHISSKPGSGTCVEVTWQEHPNPNRDILLAKWAWHSAMDPHPWAGHDVSKQYRDGVNDPLCGE